MKPETIPGATRTLILDPREVSLKRAAWAYGCAKKGSREEELLLELLLEKARTILAIPEAF